MKKFLGAVMIVLIGFTFAYAGNIDTFGIGAKATALGGAFSAYADDVYAPYYNPAGLTQLKRMQFSAGLMVLDPELKARNYEVVDLNTGATVLGPTDTSDQSENLYPPNIGFGMPVTDNMAFGIAAYAPFGVDLKWESNYPDNPAAFNAFEQGIDRVVATPTLAYKMSDQWSFGAGVSLGTASNHAKLWSYPLIARGISAYEDVDMDDDFNWSVNVGTMYKPIETVSIGLTYRSRTDTKFEGDLELASLSPAEQAALGLPKTKFDVSLDGLDFPDQVQGGVRFAPTDRVSIEADVVWTHWNIIDNEVLETDDPVLIALLGGSSEQSTPRNWNNTTQVKAGIEWKATDMWTVRGGWFYDPTPIPDDTFDVLWADADKNTYSVGLGWNFENWFVDGVFQYTRVEKDSRIIGGESENLNDTYSLPGAEREVKLEAEGEIWGYGLTVGYLF